MDAYAGRTLLHIDCTQDHARERYFEHGDTRVVTSAAGRYREAAGTPAARFGYRFDITNVGRPHVAIIRYPDDQRRFFCIMDGTCYDLTTGVFTGWEQPLSGRMIELRQVFWPRWTDCSLVFMTWGQGEPAAVASIEIRELDELPALAVPGDPGDGSRRVFGVQYEDPCGCSASEGAASHAEWIERLISYARHTGQSHLTYPMVWYHGPHYPSPSQASHSFEMVVAADRRQYNRWSTEPVDWYADLLERFGQEGLTFQGALTLMRLGSLMERMNTDLAGVQAGADTICQVMWNNQVQSGTNDWTWLYNTRNFDRIVDNLPAEGACEPHRGLDQWAYGERPTPGCHMAPIFNPLHPEVQATLVAFVGEMGQRYGRWPAFTGLAFNMFASAMPWFGSLHAGYDDLTVSRFEHDTGIAVRVDPQAPDRFARRYEFLTGTCREAWVAWRCRQIRDLFGRLHAALTAARPDLVLTITLWDETFTPGVLGPPSAATALGARAGMLALYREAGLDPALYADQPGLEIDLGLGCPRDRGGHGQNPYAGVGLANEQATMFRDCNYLDESCLAAMRALPRAGAFMFNCWVEAWGRHVWSRTEPDDPNLPVVGQMDGVPAEGLLAMNSEYPADGFWWDSQLRITPPFPAGEHFLEPYAHALAEFDACRLTRGGLFLDKAHGEYLRRFAPAYRALPNQPFETVGTVTDPVAVRTLVADGQRYLYAVNRDYYPVAVTVTLGTAPKWLRDLADGREWPAVRVLDLVLEPYGLRTFALPAEVVVEGFCAVPTGEVKAALCAEAGEALAAIAQVRANGRWVPGMDELAARLRAAVADGRLALVRRLLGSYIVRQARDWCA